MTTRALSRRNLLGRTKNGKSFLNVDYFRIKNEKVEAIECYFGGQFGYPSAASTG